ncbi:putative alpha-mannosidase I MNS5 [Auxenochlorella protothecoides]|uniref:alpha-1,2-Mannosidase n=1 Tax=Auxenochlorella protothecoides TaxID=3075 RepID=A0A087ST68_AUXPR|nr:putative alpha-mannosidase I MNS5 [Auxenochlorella protothecoides]KFM28922.1 putative alpha-mannosidase I MNS5 [Auxenochlorella protothecoides]
MRCLAGDQAREAPFPHAVLNTTTLAEEARDMFVQAYSNYTTHAFPMDDLRPLSCNGSDSQGGIGLTTLDSLDTLLVRTYSLEQGVMNQLEAFYKALCWVTGEGTDCGSGGDPPPRLTFDLDVRVHVFEVTIRALGGLLSAHQLLTQNLQLAPWYRGGLLLAAVDLADRLLPAFNTPSGIPLSWINLRHGQASDRILYETRITCTACAGTLLLEFGTLSRMTGEMKYDAAARRALEALHGARSLIGLVGNTISCDTRGWERHDSGIGAGVDSYYEYLLKAYLMFGNRTHLQWASESYAALLTHSAVGAPLSVSPWLLDVHMSTALLLHTGVWSLSAYWPGFQALAGQLEEAAAQHRQWLAVWNKFGWLPEMFDVQKQTRHPTLSGYPLRPELMESTFMLAADAPDTSYLRAGEAMLGTLRSRNQVACGYAAVHDVSTGKLSDSMESFFLSETVKYLYLLFANASAALDRWVLTTEGHFLDAWADTEEQWEAEHGTVMLGAAGAEGPIGANATSGGPVGAPVPASTGKGSGARPGGYVTEAPPGNASHDAAALMLAGTFLSHEETTVAPTQEVVSMEVETVAARCRHLCEAQDPDQVARRAAALRAALPALPDSQPLQPSLVRRRRCTACQAFTRAGEAARRARVARRHVSATAAFARQLASATARKAAEAARRGWTPPAYFLCDLRRTGGVLGCGALKVLHAGMELEDLMALRPTAVILEASYHQDGDDGAALMWWYSGVQDVQLVSIDDPEDGAFDSIQGILAEFGPAFAPPCQLGSSAGPAAEDEAELGSGPSASRPTSGGGPVEYRDPGQAPCTCPEPRLQDLLLGCPGTGAAGQDVLTEVKGPLLLAQSLFLCGGEAGPGDPAPPARGSVLLAGRGRCPFADKARAAAASQAAALIVINSGEDERAVWPMSGDGAPDLGALTMPAVMVSAAAGGKLLDLLRSRTRPTLRLRAAEGIPAPANATALPSASAAGPLPLDPGLRLASLELMVPPRSQAHALRHLSSGEAEMAGIVAAVQLALQAGDQTPGAAKEGALHPLLAARQDETCPAP